MNESDVCVRMRRRRRLLGLTGTELADRAGISTSYVSLIETGVRVPDEEVAAGLARALQDDEGLYRAWARAARLGSRDLDLITQLREVAGRLSGSRAGADAEDAPGFPSVEGVRVPVLAEREDPARPSGASGRTLLLDAALLAGSVPGSLFAYEVTAGMARLRGVASSGDVVVLRAGGSPSADRIAAVRAPGGIVLSRAVARDGSLLLLPGEGGLDFDSYPAADAQELARLVAGTQVLLIRR